jgi:hypothetical protein
LSQAAFAKLLQQYPEDGEKLLQHVITQHVVDHIGSPLYPVRWSSGVYDVSNIYVKVNTPVYIRPDDQLSAKLTIGSLDYTLRADTNPANRSNRHNRRNDNQELLY